MLQIKHTIICRRKILLLFSAAVLLFPEVNLFADNYVIGIKTGVSREVINYEEETDKLIIRGGTALGFSDLFNFDYTTIRNIDDETSTCTWNMQVKNISGFLNFTSGNYNLHFGSGLMMGKKSYSSKDPFSKKISIAKERIITPSNSGNPEYSFYGTAFEFYKTLENFKITFIPFFSLQKRFISGESFESGEIDSSIFTLNTRLKKTGNYTEPVNIINYGGVIGIDLIALFNFQFYYFQTDLKGDSGKEILWDKDKYYGVNGINLLRNGGFFAEYADNNISIFVEPAVSSIGNESSNTDFAIAWGIGIQNSIMNFSLKGKNSGLNFHSEYSSGSRTPERIWELKCGLYPYKNFETGFIVYTEKDLIPGYNKDYTEGAIHEEIFASLDTDKIDINLNVKRRDHYSTDRGDTVDQCNISAGISPTDRFYFKIRSSAQKSSNGISGLAGCEIKYLFSGYMSFSAGYTKIYADKDKPFYAVITPASEHSSISCFNNPAHGGSLNLKYKKEKNSFYVRLTITRSASEWAGDAESALTLFF